MDVLAIFLSYVFLGLSLGAPIGPINAAQINQGIKNGFFHSWFIGLGSILAELFFISAVFFGVVHFLETEFVKTFLWSFGAFVLIYTGIESMHQSQKLEQTRDGGKDSVFKAFFSGFLISISNPLSILFWLGIYGSVLANTIHKYDNEHLILYGAAIILGLMLWDVFMASVSSGFRNFLTDRMLKGISNVTGLSLLCFGIYFGYQAIVLLFFS